MPEPQTTISYLNHHSVCYHEPWSMLQSRQILFAHTSKSSSSSLLSRYFVVHEAFNGLQALKLAEDLQPDVIISQVQLPLLNGLELCQQVRAHQQIGSIPFILISNSHGRFNQLQCYQAGADLHLVHPLKQEVIIQVVTNYIIKQEKLKQGLRSNHFTEITSTGIVVNKDDDFLQQTIQYLEEKLSDPAIDASYLCEKLAMSRTSLYQKIKKLTGQSVHEFIKSVRLKNSLHYLIEGRLTINQIAFEVGFNSHSYFDKCFIKHYGITPKAYIRKHTQ
ncbi:response regulator transcription factor [Fulvivirga ligni]|uniref:response regulator transcription factor n=1 Tax=Fulvivirga ligni TaxID=2904246 RepID=UPI001F1B4D18|nr:response regulator transcription factor [Fulvivirga ligni]UII20695.1 response regulator transcription factor [Fulvivirga ligni]